MPALPNSDTFDLGSWTSLRSLMTALDDYEGVRCPPNLTKLELFSDSTLPKSFLPLPTSLTEISSDFFAPFSALAPLENLRSFECRSMFGVEEARKVNLLTTLSFLPPGLTSLALPSYVWESESAARALSLSLTALETIIVSGYRLSITALDRLYHSFPDRLTFKTSSLSIYVVLEKVARLCNIPLDSILVPKDEPLYFWCRPAMKKTYPRINGAYEIYCAETEDGCQYSDEEEDEQEEEDEAPEATVKKTRAAWSDFAPYLSSENEQLLIVSDVIELPPDFAKTLPRGLKSLDARSTLTILEDVSNLPSTLTKLNLHTMALRIDDARALPRSLTSLHVGMLLHPPSNGEGSPEWPPGLVEMSLFDSLEFLDILPSSLTKLSSSVPLTVELLEALPVGLKYYEDDYDAPWDEKMVSIAIERNLTRLSQHFHFVSQSSIPPLCSTKSLPRSDRPHINTTRHCNITYSDTSSPIQGRKGVVPRFFKTRNEAFS